MITSFNFGERCKIFEYPAVFEGMEDGVEQFSGGSDDGFACSAPGLDILKETVEVWAISFCNERALHEGCACQLVAAFGDTPGIVGFV